MRFTVQPQKHTLDFPFDRGYALIDSVARRQVGYWLDKSRAVARAAERNAAEEQAPPRETAAAVGHRPSVPAAALPVADDQGVLFPEDRGIAYVH